MQEFYKQWWTAVYKAAQARGEKEFSTTPEFGPAPYAWTHPYTDLPIADVWEVNHFIGQEVQTLYASLFDHAFSSNLVAETDDTTLSVSTNL